MFFFKSFNVVVVVLMTLTFIQLNCATNSDKKQDAKCLLPMERGPCSMNLKRFYYNANTDTCEEFKFGGCKGNDNKFGFKHTCEAACKKSTNAAAVSKLTTAAATASTTEPAQTMTKQLKSDIVNTLNTNQVKMSTTTAKPGTARTTLRTFMRTTTTTTVQKLK